MENLDGKVAVVTGAASGIGWALARRFVDEGMRVVLADIEAPRLEERRAELAAAGGSVTAAVCDVSKCAEVEALRDHALDTFGAVHVVCNNAGVGGGGQMATLTDNDWSWVLGVNLWGVIHGIEAFLPGMLAQGEGHIVNTASVAGLFAAPFMGPYNASKYAVVAISETLFSELAMSGTNVGCSVLCPSWVATEIALSERNRPAELRNDAESADAEAGEGMRQMLHQFIQTGKAPEDVADHVTEAIKTRTFYILTHDDSVPAVRARLEAIISGGDPPMLMPQ